MLFLVEGTKVGGRFILNGKNYANRMTNNFQIP